jgi:hypothetical protein
MIYDDVCRDLSFVPRRPGLYEQMHRAWRMGMYWRLLVLDRPDPRKLIHVTGT